MRRSNGGGGGGGPCGACKFLRRKCVKGCIFAPYFDSDQGTAHFAAVHKVFGASNASKMLLRTPPHKRVDAVVTLCYEALARVRDPVYGCVGHIVTLQQQVVNLQAELAFIQARLSTIQCVSLQLPLSPSTTTINVQSSSSDRLASTRFDPATTSSSMELVSFCNSIDDQENEEGDDDLQALAREFMSRYLPGVKFRSSTPH